MNGATPVREPLAAQMRPARPRPVEVEILERLACNCQNIRKRRKWSQTDLSQRCGFGPDFIRHVELGAVRITLGDLETLSIELGCTLPDLVRRLSLRRRWWWRLTKWAATLRGP